MLHHSKPARLTILVKISLLFALTVSCTPEQVTEGATKIGVVVNAEQAQAISDRLTAARPEMVELASYTPAPTITEEQARAIAWTAAIAEQQKAAPAIPAGTTATGWKALRNCESGGNYATNSGNGYYGAYQFNQSTWASNAPAGYTSMRPSSAPAVVQDQAAFTLYQRRSWHPWPVCGRFIR